MFDCPPGNRHDTPSCTNRPKWLSRASYVLRTSRQYAKISPPGIWDMAVKTMGRYLNFGISLLYLGPMVVLLKCHDSGTILCSTFKFEKFESRWVPRVVGGGHSNVKGVSGLSKNSRN